MAETNTTTAVATKPANLEELLSGDQVVSLGRSLKLTDTQIAKANKSILDMSADPKLKDATTMSKVRFAYTVSTLNYKNSNAVAPVVYGNGIQAQLQYQAFIEDMLECGGLKDNKVSYCFLYEGIDYKPRLIGDYTVLELPQSIEVKDMFNKPKIIGYYCYAETKDYGIITSVMSVEQVKKWASTYSISYKSGKHSPYTTNFDDMGLKTVIKAVGRAVLKHYPFDRLSQSLNMDFAVFDDNGVSYKDSPQTIEEQPTNGTLKNKIFDVVPDDEVEEQPQE